MKNFIKFLLPKSDKEKLKALSSLFYHGKYKECVTESKIIINSKNSALALDAKRFCGLSNYKLRRFEDAKNLFSEIAEVSNNQDDWFNLCTSATRAKDINLGKQAFDNFFKSGVVQAENKMLSMPNVVYQYVIALRDIKEYELALDQYKQLIGVYAKLQCTEEIHLQKRGVPFLYQTLVIGKEIMQNNYTVPEYDLWLTKLAKQVDIFGKESIDEFRERENIGERDN